MFRKFFRDMSKLCMNCNKASKNVYGVTSFIFIRVIIGGYKNVTSLKLLLYTINFFLLLTLGKPLNVGHLFCINYLVFNHWA